MPWLWALTGNSLLDGHERVVGQISQLHPTASERGGPSLSLQLWKVSDLQSLPPAPSPFPPCPPRDRSCQLGSHFYILAVSHLPQHLLHEQGEGGGWGLAFFFFFIPPEEEFFCGLGSAFSFVYGGALGK